MNIYICSLAEELLAKESITLPDILRILGDRPYPLKETVREYLEELIERKEKDDIKTEQDNQAAANTVLENQKEADKKEQEETEKNAQVADETKEVENQDATLKTK